ncbi:putative T7SS-secreted protein [Amycolatopsis sp. NPDC101161]|uniref:putative T7SS-secreted protein n=1 Tax=Amycolatopsis sp. NPDC101161 TaxID=3363940 RepID=UPI00381D43D6
MAELGETDDPKALVPGEAKEIRASTVHLTVYGDTMIRIGEGFKKLDTGGWSGPAADAYHERTHAEPARWLTAGDAFHAAAAAINGYASTLDWAQGQAQQAIDLWKQGEDATRQGRTAYDRDVAAAEQEAASRGEPPPTAAPFQDPGESKRARARSLLHEARSQLDSAGDQAVGQADKAQAGAPEEPTFLDDIGDGLTSAAEFVGHNLGVALGDVTSNVMNAAGDFASDVVHVAGDIVHDLGDGVGGVLRDVGELTGSDDLKNAGTTVTSSMHDAADAVDRAGDTADHWLQERGNDAKAFLSGDEPEPKGPHYVIIDQGDYPEAADHAREAQMGMSWRGDESFPRTQPSDVTIDREGAEDRRTESMKQVPQTRPGYDRDEYPPAVFLEGGEGSSVKYIDPFDNRGAGSSVKNQIRDLDNGERVTILVD